MKLNKHKRGNAGGAATLIFLMGLFFLIYILTLPDSTRQELFPGAGRGGEISPIDNPSLIEPEGILLDERPGLISYVSFTENEISIPPLTVMTTKSSKILTKYLQTKIVRGMLTNKYKELHFTVDKDLVNNVVLSFNVLKASDADLIIILNGETILEKRFNVGSPNPIELPNNLLRDNNTLIIEVSSPGLAFWRINEYVLENIMVAANVVDTSSSTAVVQFNVPADEYDNTENIELRFIAECQNGGSKLYVKINGEVVYEGIPECGITTKVAVPKAYVAKGINTISFSSYSRYAIHNARLKLIYFKPDYPLYFFNVPEELFINPGTENETIRDDVSVKLRMRFADTNYKKAVISINGFKLRIDGYETEYEKEIKDYLYSGANAIKIVPEKSGLEITSLRIEYSFINN